MRDAYVWSESEKYKEGWVTGFYDSRSDDGLRYLDDILRYGVRSPDDHSFMAGYRAGQQARRGPASLSSERTSADMKTAA